MHFFSRISPIIKYKVHEQSMIPTLPEGSIVFVNRFAYLFSKPKAGDIVVFSLGEKTYIKRIIENNKETVFVEGDNKKESIDSRRFGSIKKSVIIGKVIGR